MQSMYRLKVHNLAEPRHILQHGQPHVVEHSLGPATQQIKSTELPGVQLCCETTQTTGYSMQGD
jgi:hypothetical protein